MAAESGQNATASTTTTCLAYASKTPEQIDAAIRQLVSKAITTEGQVIDVFTAAGLPKPDISILSDQFLAEVRGLKHKNVTAELLEKLLKDELKVRSKRNLVQSQVFSEKLKKTLNAYHNRAISTMQVIEELIKLAKDLDAATKRSEDMGLTDDEIAFLNSRGVLSTRGAWQAPGRVQTALPWVPELHCQSLGRRKSLDPIFTGHLFAGPHG
jgi:type I site-specific restriction-modification system R (restriction) subunit